MNNKFIKEQTALIAYQYRDGSYYVQDYINTQQLLEKFEELKDNFYKAYIYKVSFSNIPELHHCKILLKTYLNDEELYEKDKEEIEEFIKTYQKLYWECDEIIAKRKKEEDFKKQQLEDIKAAQENLESGNYDIIVKVSPTKKKLPPIFLDISEITFNSNDD